MYKVSINFWKRINRGEKPITYCLIQTAMGYRAYAEKELQQTFEVGGTIFDGAKTFDGSWTLGPGLGLIEKAGRVLSFGQFERTIQPKTRDVIGSLLQKQLQHVSVMLDNHDHHFTKILPKESFLARPLSYYVGFEADPFAEHISLFRGIISEIRVEENGTQISIQAEEK